MTEELPQVFQEPFDEAHISLIEGPQGGGKSNFAVGRPVDSWYKDAVRRFFLEAYNREVIVKSYDRRKRIAKVIYNGEKKFWRVPEDAKLRSPMRIFSNIHLYGVPYVFCPSFNHILFWLRQGLIVNGYLIIDESYVGIAARDSMTKLTKQLQKQSMQFRKMQLEVEIITPLASLIDKTARAIPTEHVLCSYDKKKKEVTAIIRKRGEDSPRTVTYDATQYYGNYRTNERINQ